MNQILTDIMGLFRRKEIITDAKDGDLIPLAGKKVTNTTTPTGVVAPDKMSLISTKDFVENYIVPKVTVSGDIHVDDVYSHKLYTDSCNVVAKITGYSEQSAASDISVDDIQADSSSIRLQSWSNNLPTFVTGDQLILYTQGTDAEVVIKLTNINSSYSGELDGYFDIVSGVSTPYNYQSRIGIQSAITTINLDTDLTQRGITAGDKVILGAIIYELAAITSSSITINSNVANIDKLSTVGVGDSNNPNTGLPESGAIDVLSYKASLTDGTVVEKTPILSFDLIKNKLKLSTAHIDFNYNSSQNTFIGQQSGNSITSGGGNTALGNSTLPILTTGYNNVAIGNSSGLQNQTGSNNVSIGSQSMRTVTNASNNVAIGMYALGETNQSASNNVAIGNEALKRSPNANNNTAVGNAALKGWFNSDNNTAIGSFALEVLTNGNNNTALGANSFKQGRTGSDNVVIGYFADLGGSNGTGSNNTIVGANANGGNGSGSIVLGDQAEASGSNQFVVGSSATNAGTVATESNSSTKVWNVKINGTDYKILLA